MYTPDLKAPKGLLFQKNPENRREGETAAAAAEPSKMRIHPKCQRLPERGGISRMKGIVEI
jgi:hypothetical protein